MELTKGLITDCLINKQPEGSWRNAKNLVILKDKTITQENGLSSDNKLTMLNATFNKIIVGKIVTPDVIVLFSVNSDGTGSEIGLFDNKDESPSAYSYTTIITHNDLAFSIDHSIIGTASKNSKGELIIAFIDDINVPRVINLNNLPLIGGVLDVNETAIFQGNKIPIFDSISIVNGGGSLRSSSCQIVLTYSDDNSQVGSFTNISKPINITTASETADVLHYFGCNTDILTTKQIQFNLSNVDNTYKFLNVYMIRSIANVISAFKIKSIEIGSNTTLNNITISGNEAISAVSLDSILIPTAHYTNAKAITQLNNELILADLSADEIFAFQNLANDIEINWDSTLVDCSVINSSDKTNTERGFEHGAVYAFYFVPILNNSKRLIAFHIPGREMEVGEDVTDFQTTGAYTNYFINNNTIFPSGTKLFQAFSTASHNGTKGIMGYWENSNEQYPILTEEHYEGGQVAMFPTGNVRHHRMPSIRQTYAYHNNLNPSSVIEYGKTILDKLSINVSNVVIPDAIRDRIQGWKIYYAKRELNNRISVGQSLLQIYGRREPNSDDDDYIYPTAGNWELDNTAIRETYQIVEETDPTYKFGAINSFNLQVDKPEINPVYISSELQLVFTALSTSITTYPECGITGDNTRRFLFLHTRAIECESFATLQQSYLTQVVAKKYIPNNVLINYEDSDFRRINNKYGNATLILKLKNPDSYHSIAPTKIGNNTFVIPGQIVYFLTNLNQLLSDVFIDFYNQELVSTNLIKLTDKTTDYVATPDSLDNIMGGDVFIGYHSMITTAPVRAQYDSNDITEGTKACHYYLCESMYNLNLIYDDGDVDNSKYFPKTPIHDTSYLNGLFDGYNNKQVQTILYAKDYNMLNELDIVTCFNPYSTTLSSFPNRIIRCTANRESDDLGWKTFLANNYYELRKDKGDINFIYGKNNTLLIQCKHSTFVAKLKDVLQTGDVLTYIGVGDLFDREPDELISSNQSYAGNSDQFSFVDCKNGLFWCDRITKKLFIFTDKLHELNGDGNDELIKQLTTLNNKNYIIGSSSDANFVAEYDVVHNRIVMRNNSKTYSYSFEINALVCKHDYPIDWTNLITLNNKSYLALRINDTSQLRQLNSSLNIAKYNTVNPKDSFIECVFSGKESILLRSVDWKTTTINDIVSGLQKYYYDKTFTHIMIYTEEMCTGIIPLSEISNKKLRQVFRNNERRFSVDNLRDELVHKVVVSNEPETLLQKFSLVNSEYFIDDETLNPNCFTKNTIVTLSGNKGVLQFDKPYYMKNMFICDYFIVRLYCDNISQLRTLFYDVDINGENSER